MDDQNNKSNISISIGGDNSGDFNVNNTYNIGRLEEAGLVVETDPQVNAQKVRLFQVLVDAFNLDELAELALGLGINFEDVAGQNRRARARELVEYMGRRDRLDDLEAQVHHLRPSATDVSSASSPPEQAAGT